MASSRGRFRRRTTWSFACSIPGERKTAVARQMGEPIRARKKDPKGFVQPTLVIGFVSSGISLVVGRFQRRDFLLSVEYVAAHLQS